MILLCSDVKDCIFEVKSVVFNKNKACRNGGAFYWVDIMPIETDVKYTDNTAHYGDDTASFPIRLQSINDQGELIEFQNRRLEGTPVANSFD
mmetsp:Transcript_11803/g.1764  ORF Transcript_11803/g.1764 Transcript_11803/m.1764 type:complete len:92 (+) Transcript_11803:748-1023(+)